MSLPYHSLYQMVHDTLREFPDYKDGDTHDNICDVIVQNPKMFDVGTSRNDWLDFVRTERDRLRAKNQTAPARKGRPRADS